MVLSLLGCKLGVGRLQKPRLALLLPMSAALSNRISLKPCGSGFHAWIEEEYTFQWQPWPAFTQPSCMTCAAMMGAPGAVQGMSDLAAPLLCVMRDEAEAFWCFACLMEKLEVGPAH